MNRKHMTAVLAVTMFGLPLTVHAAAVVDSSWGRAPQTLGGPANPNFTISQGLGRLSGNNLFHSFQTFNISPGESATFTTTTPSIANVITRVTGNEASSINGMLKLQPLNGGQPNFFFINPNGVSFGAGAQIDVPAAFHVSTANNLRFSDGTVFAAGAGPDNTLTAAAPEAFGFLGGDQTAVAVRFANLSKTLLLQKPPYTQENTTASPPPDYSPQNVLAMQGLGNSLDITAGAIEVVHSNLSVLFGSIRLAATGTKPATVELALRPMASFSGPVSIVSSDILGSVLGNPIIIQGADIRIVNSSVSNLIVSAALASIGRKADADPSIHLNGERITIDRSDLNSNISGNGRGGSVFINASERASISQSSVSSSATGGESSTQLSGGDVEIRAPYISVDKNSVIRVSAMSVNQPSNTQMGSIRLYADNAISITDHSSINTITIGGIKPGTLFSSANSGEIRLTSPIITIGGHSDITVSTYGISNAGSIFMESRRSSDGGLSPLTISGDGTGSVNANTVGSGNGGAINVNGRDVSITGVSLESLAYFVDGLSASPNVGNAGAITVSALGSVTLGAGSGIVSSTTCSGDAGKINMSGGSVQLDGAIVSSSTGAAGRAGTVIISSPGEVALRNDSRIRTNTSGSGAAGAVDIQAGSLFVDYSGIASAAGSQSSGQTGNVTLSVKDRLTLTGGARIDIGNAATVSDPGRVIPTALSVSASDIVAEHGAQLTASSTGNVAAGTIAMSAGNTLMLRDSAITTTTQSGNGGAIAVSGGKMVWLKNSQISTSVAGLVGNGGNIDVNTGALILEAGFIQANTAAANASGGRIAINAKALIPSGGLLLLGGANPVNPVEKKSGFNVIQAAAPDGISGDVQLASPQLDLAARLASLASPVMDTSVLSRDLCRIGTGSSLTQIQRAGIMLSPTDYCCMGRTQAGKRAF